MAQHIDELILVDVTKDSLATISTSSPLSYVALSYVWGNAPMFKTTGSNFEALLRPGALYDKGSGITLPDTVRDAMHLVKALGERYLWVDCLSVVQDADLDTINITLRAMARIYANADFTIVAAGGEDASYGLRGIGGPSMNRGPTPSSYSHLWDAYPEDSKWATRGWTFQESLFSRRLLIIRDTVSWICGRCQWLEGVDELASAKDIHDPGTTTTLGTANGTWPAERPHLGIPMGMMSLIPTMPSLGRWGMLVENFSSRNLTYDKDAQAAFAGATEVMDTTFPDGLLHGMPMFFFDIALLWLPKESVRRREGEPSWSWTGWKNGTIDCLSAWYPFYASIFHDAGHASEWASMATLRPVAEYRITNAVDGVGSKFNDFYRYQALREKPDDTLPAGWSRHYHPAGDYFTSTASLRRAAYPFPLPTVDLAERRVHFLSWPVLHCLAPSAHLTFGHMVICDKTHRKLMNLCIEEETVGNLALMCDAIDHQPQYGSVCELVAISGAETSRPAHVADRGWPVMSFKKKQELLYWMFTNNDFRKASFYNVMWIKWVGDVAERRGVGVVLKESWDALQPEIKEFNLG